VRVAAGLVDASLNEVAVASISGSWRARRPLVFLSTRRPPDALVCPSSSSPGEGVVWRRTVQIQSVVLMSRRRHPDTSPMRAAAHDLKITASAQRMNS
jgi:hypothetical protein